MKSQPNGKRVRHFMTNGHLYELTFPCYRRQPLLRNESWRRILANHLEAACQPNTNTIRATFETLAKPVAHKHR